VDRSGERESKGRKDGWERARACSDIINHKSKGAKEKRNKEDDDDDDDDKEEGSSNHR